MESARKCERIGGSNFSDGLTGTLLKIRDVSFLARAIGLDIDVKISAGLWDACIAVPDDFPGGTEGERLFDLLTAFSNAAHEAKTRGEGELRFAYEVNTGDAIRKVPLRAICGAVEGGDDLAAILMLDDEHPEAGNRYVNN